MNPAVPLWVRKSVVGVVVLVVIAVAARSQMAERFVRGMIHGPGDTYVVSAAGGKVTVVPQGKWRIHTGYRWVVTCGGKSATGSGGEGGVGACGGRRGGGGRGV